MTSLRNTREKLLSRIEFLFNRVRSVFPIFFPGYRFIYFHKPVFVFCSLGFAYLNTAVFYLSVSPFVLLVVQYPAIRPIKTSL